MDAFLFTRCSHLMFYWITCRDTCDKMAECDSQTGPCIVFNNPAQNEPDLGTATFLYFRCKLMTKSEVWFDHLENSCYLELNSNWWRTIMFVRWICRQSKQGSPPPSIFPGPLFDRVIVIRVGYHCRILHCKVMFGDGLLKCILNVKNPFSQ